MNKLREVRKHMRCRGCGASISRAEEFETCRCEACEYKRYYQVWAREVVLPNASTMSRAITALLER